MLDDLLAVTMPPKERYCKRHGYDLLQPPLEGTGCNQDEMYGFKRLVLVIEMLKSGAYDWLWVSGCDVLITNHSITLESLIDDDYGMVIGTEPTGVGMDSFLIRKEKGGLELMERLLTFRKCPVGGAHEQSTLDHLRKDPEVAKVIKLLPQRKLNAYKYANLHQYAFLHQGFVTGTDHLGNSGEWQSGDFVLHTPGLPYTEQKLKIFAEVIPLVQE
jgi:hypothetical protein